MCMPRLHQLLCRTSITPHKKAITCHHSEVLLLVASMVIVCGVTLCGTLQVGCAMLRCTCTAPSLQLMLSDPTWCGWVQAQDSKNRSYIWGR
jgi:hypothetical protein